MRLKLGGKNLVFPPVDRADFSWYNTGETMGEEKDYGEKFIGKNADRAADVETVSGATKTTNGYKEAILLAFEAFEKIK